MTREEKIMSRLREHYDESLQHLPTHSAKVRKMKKTLQ